MGHQINLEELNTWMNDGQLILFASSSVERKRLYATLRGSFEVHLKGEKVWEGMQSFEAVEQYNKI